MAAWGEKNAFTYSCPFRKLCSFHILCSSHPRVFKLYIHLAQAIKALSRVKRKGVPQIRPNVTGKMAETVILAEMARIV